MRRTGCLLCGLLTLAVLSGSPVSAQSARTYQWFVAPEVSFVVSPELATDYYVSGFGIGFGMEYPVSPNWSLVGMVNYKRYAPAEGMIADWWDDPGEWPGSTNIRVSEGTLQALTFALLGKGTLKRPESRSWPYVKGGFGLTLAGADEIKVDFTNSSGSPQTAWQLGADSDVNTAVLLALGYEFAMAGGASSLFVELGFEVLMIEATDNPSLAPIRVGYKF